MACHDKELSVLITGDEGIRRLNKRYLGRDRPTNVLAFPMGEEGGSNVESGMLGDVVISLETAEREARASGENLDEAVDRLLVHGLVHLLGYDHEASIEEADRMRTEEERLMRIMMEE